jgi:16S rRNA (guanine966-N2)-methyltransferase
MRIIAGEWRGRKIVAPPGDATRPTADRTRETLFSMLVSRLGSFEGLRIADLFAGSGALGLEALSRGAAHVSFIENDMAAVKVIQANLAALGATARADVRLASALKLPSAPAFDLILADLFAQGSGRDDRIGDTRGMACRGRLAGDRDRAEAGGTAARASHDRRRARYWTRADHAAAGLMRGVRRPSTSRPIRRLPSASALRLPPPPPCRLP